jgi:hypothetical protein
VLLVRKIAMYARAPKGRKLNYDKQLGSKECLSADGV